MPWAYSSSSTNSSVSLLTEVGEKAVPTGAQPSKKDLRFWLIFASMCTCIFFSTLELSSVSTALPTIANALQASQFTWVGTAYNLAATVFHPIGGGMAQSYGRRPALLLALGFFALGSGICGAANSMSMLVAGRIIQGLGGGGIQSLTRIVLADLVTLQERGLYIGLYGCANCLAAAIGPVIGGSLATRGRWRWLFYLNLPMSVVACASAMFLRDLPIPSGSAREMFMRLDWIGNILVISSTVACTIGLTWGGTDAPWGSAIVLVPLVLGLVGLVFFMVYEATYATHPLVPFSLITNRTSVSGFIQNFCNAVVTAAVIYFCPLYYQACKDASPVMSGVYSLAFSSLALFALVAGISVALTKRYRPQMWVGWAITIAGLGMTSTVLATDPLHKSIGFFFMLGVGAGILNGTMVYPIQAPLSITQNAPVLGFAWFIYSFATVCGITIGGTVVQNMLKTTLPTSFIQTLPEGTATMYELVPNISALDPQTRLEVQAAFAKSLAVLWQVLAGVSGIGLIASLFMKGLPLHNRLDSDWAMKDEKEGRSTP